MITIIEEVALAVYNSIFNLCVFDFGNFQRPYRITKRRTKVPAEVVAYRIHNKLGELVWRPATRHIKGYITRTGCLAFEVMLENGSKIILTPQSIHKNSHFAGLAHQGNKILWVINKDIADAKTKNLIENGCTASKFIATVQNGIFTILK